MTVKDFFALAATGLGGAVRRAAMMLLVMVLTAISGTNYGTCSAAEPTSNTSLLHLFWKNSESVTLYTADMLEGAGLLPGDEIESITFKGYSSNYDNYETQLSVWYEKTEDTSQSQPADGIYNTNTEGMIPLLSETRSWTAVGSSDNLVDLITINLAEPITYEGGGFRFVVLSEGSFSSSRIFFEVTSTGGDGLSYYLRDDIHDYCNHSGLG